jgi:hypothetical protein
MTTTKKTTAQKTSTKTTAPKAVKAKPVDRTNSRPSCEIHFAFEDSSTCFNQQRSSAKKVEVLQKFNHPSLKALVHLEL